MFVNYMVYFFLICHLSTSMVSRWHTHWECYLLRPYIYTWPTNWPMGGEVILHSLGCKPQGLLLQPAYDRGANLELRCDNGNVQLNIRMMLPCCTRLCVLVFWNPQTCLAAIHSAIVILSERFHIHPPSKRFWAFVWGPQLWWEVSRLGEVNGCERFVGNSGECWRPFFLQCWLVYILSRKYTVTCGLIWWDAAHETSSIYVSIYIYIIIFI